MKIRDQQAGEVNFLLVSLIFMIVLFLTSLGFGVWAFMERQDYKNNSDKKAAAAAEVASQQTAAQKDNEFVEKEKYPLKTFKGPSDLGAVSLKYPKTWSAYISTSDDNFFIFNPDIVSANDNALYALKVSVLSEQYNDVIGQFEGQVQDGKATAKAYTLDKVPSVLGVRFDGEIEDGQPGSVVVLPLRDKTITIACQIPDSLKDFNKIILPNISFNP